MSKPTIRMGHPLGQTPPNVYSDFDWVRLHQDELLAKYGICSVIVYKEQVIGIGATYKAALEDAERNLDQYFSGDVAEITPIHDWIGPRLRLYKVTSSETPDNR